MFSTRPVMLILGLLILLPSLGSATLPENAETIVLDQSVEGMAPGAYYKIELAGTGTMAVVMDSVPMDMMTRVIIMNADGLWLASQDSAGPGELMTVSAPIDAPGWYWIEVLDLEGKTHDTPYAFHATQGRFLLDH